MKNIILGILCAMAVCKAVEAQPKRIESQFRIARLKYSGGGDWYNGTHREK